MSGAHRKVSRSLIDASATVSPGTGSHSHFKQPENELKLKLDALDTSRKISSKKISSETRELRQILFDLQRDLKGSKNVNQYVPSSFEEQQGQAKRQRRITVASGSREVNPRNGRVPVKTSSTETSESLQEKSRGSKGTPTKRQRKVSGASPHSAKVVVHEEDVLKSQNIEKIVTEKQIGLETDGVVVTVDQSAKCEPTNKLNSNSSEQEGQQTEARKQQDHANDVVSESTYTSERSNPESIQQHRNLAPAPVQELNKNARDTEDIKTSPRVRKTSHSGVFSYSEARTDATDPIKATPTGSNYGLTYSKHFNEDRKRSLSDSDASYRDAFKGRFLTQSLPEKLKDQCRIELPSQDAKKRTRRVTVAGPPPMVPRRLLDVGDIPVTPFNSGSRRTKNTSGRGPTGLLSMRKGSEGDDDVFDGIEKDASRGRYNLTVGRPQEPRQRRYSSVYKTSSSLPPLKEETRNTTKHAEVTKQWENLESCRYLRKGDEALSIEDIFRKD